MVLVRDNVDDFLGVLVSEDRVSLPSLAVVSVFHGPRVVLSVWEVLDNLPPLPM